MLPHPVPPWSPQDEQGDTPIQQPQFDSLVVTQYNFFILEVLKAWITPAMKHPRTIHHLGKGAFMVAGETIKLPSKMK